MPFITQSDNLVSNRGTMDTKPVPLPRRGQSQPKSKPVPLPRKLGARNGSYLSNYVRH